VHRHTAELDLEDVSRVLTSLRRDLAGLNEVAQPAILIPSTTVSTRMAELMLFILRRP